MKTKNEWHKRPSSKSVTYSFEFSETKKNWVEMTISIRIFCYWISIEFRNPKMKHYSGFRIITQWWNAFINIHIFISIKTNIDYKTTFNQRNGSIHRKRHNNIIELSWMNSVKWTKKWNAMKRKKEISFFSNGKTKLPINLKNINKTIKSNV